MRRRARIFVFWAAVCSVSLTTPDVQAQSAPEDARALFDRGVQALNAQDFESAVAAFERSVALDARASALCNLALAYDRWPGHEREAAQAYRRCAEVDSDGAFRATAIERAETLSNAHAGQRGDHGPASPPVILSPRGETSERAPARPRRLTFTLLSLVAGSAGSGAIVMRRARHISASLESEFPNRQVSDAGDWNRVQQSERLVRVGRALYVVSGLGTAASVVSLIRWLRATREEDSERDDNADEPNADEPASVGLQPSAGGFVANVHGSF